MKKAKLEAKITQYRDWFSKMDSCIKNQDGLIKCKNVTIRLLQERINRQEKYIDKLKSVIAMQDARNLKQSAKIIELDEKNTELSCRLYRALTPEAL